MPGPLGARTMVLCDLAGKVLKRPVYELLGGTNTGPFRMALSVLKCLMERSLQPQRGWTGRGISILGGREFAVSLVTAGGQRFVILLISNASPRGDFKRRASA